MSLEKTMHVINDVVSTVKMFEGDIFGSVVRDMRICGRTDVNNVNVRLDYCHVKPFLTIMNTRYSVESLPPKIRNGVNVYCYRMSNKHNAVPFEPVVLDIVLMNPKMFRIAFTDFDVNLLSENDTCLYIRTVPQPLKYCADKISLLKQRMLNKSFSIVDTFGPQKLPGDIVDVVSKAIEMTVAANWTMDDFYARPTWIVGKWDDIVIGKHRRKHTREMYSQMVSLNQCCLCHDKFKTNDIVFNTACNHNFHWMCNAKNGLKVWVEHSKTCCPVCRCNMFSGAYDVVETS